MSIWENSGDWPKNARLAIEEIADQRNALRDEVAELKRKLAEVEGERDALRELLSEALEDQRPDHMAVDCKCWVCRAEELYSPAK